MTERPTQQEILNALQIIKKTCEAYPAGACFDCPFNSSDTECMLGRDYPCDWKIKPDVITPWRAFL